MWHDDCSKTVSRSYSTAVLKAKYPGVLQLRPFKNYDLSANILGMSSGWITLSIMQLCSHDQLYFG